MRLGVPMTCKTEAKVTIEGMKSFILYCDFPSVDDSFIPQMKVYIYTHLLHLAPAMSSITLPSVDNNLSPSSSPNLSSEVTVASHVWWY